MALNLIFNKKGNKQTLSSKIQDMSLKEFVKAVIHSSYMLSITFPIQLEGLLGAEWLAID